MKRLIHAVWRQGVLSTFLTGLLALLPLAITVAIVVWVVGYLGALLGPESLVGRGLRAIGLKFVHQADETTATAIGVAVAIVGIWLLGVFVKQKARHFYAFQAAMENVHAETHALLIDTYLANDDARKRFLFQSIERVPSIKHKAEWALRWCDAKQRTFAERGLCGSRGGRLAQSGFVGVYPRRPGLGRRCGLGRPGATAR